MATYTPPKPYEPGGWEFTDEELQQEADKHFAKMCGDTDEIAEAFGPDAWGGDDMQVERDLHTTEL